MSHEEQQLPEDTPRIRVRPISADERSEWDRLMRAHHYLGLKALVGRSLRYVAHTRVRSRRARDTAGLARLGLPGPEVRPAGCLDWLVEVTFPHFHRHLRFRDNSMTYRKF